MPNNPEKFIQANSPDGGFLQSEQWRKFQESVGHRTFHIEQEGFWANIIEHQLPIVGKYFYIPRGPIASWNMEHGTCLPDRQAWNKKSEELINLAKENNAGWIRIDPANEEILNSIRNKTKFEIIKAPHDMQPREIFVIDISKPEEEILADMKAKTRYNIKLAEKKGIKTWNMEHETWNKKYVEDFLRLTKIMAERQGIAVHPDEYYRKMLDTIPGDFLKLYVAEFEGKIIAANIVVHYGNTATYLHGASDDKYRNLMAPYLLQWKQIQDAASAGCEKYDFGGIKLTNNQQLTTNNWEGITRFKIGFSPKTSSTEFPGSYDIILNRKKYYLYRAIQKIKSFL